MSCRLERRSAANAGHRLRNANASDAVPSKSGRAAVGGQADEQRFALDSAAVKIDPPHNAAIGKYAARPRPCGSSPTALGMLNASAAPPLPNVGRRAVAVHADDVAVGVNRALAANHDCGPVGLERDRVRGVGPNRTWPWVDERRGRASRRVESRWTASWSGIEAGAEAAADDELPRAGDGGGGRSLPTSVSTVRPA